MASQDASFPRHKACDWKHQAAICQHLNYFKWTLAQKRLGNRRHWLDIWHENEMANVDSWFNWYDTTHPKIKSCVHFQPSVSWNPIKFVIIYSRMYYARHTGLVVMTCILFLCGARDQTQGLVSARHVLYRWATPQPSCGSLCKSKLGSLNCVEKNAVISGLEPVEVGLPLCMCSGADE